ncbi:MAG: helix-turn-helix domain-containing protein [Campylobacterota bacterium]|nr:helix-turn-helix domain-containing protein [Campylobacterota bacterium]
MATQDKISLEEVDCASKYEALSLSKRWLSPDDLFIILGISKSSQAKMRMVSNSSTIPFSKVGKYIRYDRHLIDAWLEQHQVQGEVA